jgi:predicted dehydrogenase
MQCGTQARSSAAIQQAVEFVRNGGLGKIQYAVGTCYKPRPSIGKLDQPRAIPKEINYDLWCGPAAKVDLYRPQFHYDWHWDFNTGCGDIGNQGLHQMDVARWFLGEQAVAPRVISIGGRLGYEDAANTPNTQVAYHDYPAAPLIFEVRGLPTSKQAWKQDWAANMDHYRQSQIGVIVQCEQGHVFASNSYVDAEAFDADGNEIKRWTGGGDHFQNFLAAVRSGRRGDLNAEILEGHLSSALAHTGNISHKLGEKRTAAEIGSLAEGRPALHDSVDRMLTHLRANEIDVDRPTVTVGPWLEIDPATEQFTNSSPANNLARRDDRPPFVVPQVAQA